MTAYQGNWYFSTNTSPWDTRWPVLQARSFILQFKNFLTGAGWSVERSSNGTGVYTGDSLNSDPLHWKEHFNDATIPGASFVWLVFKSPAGIVAGEDGSYTGDQSCLWFVIGLHSTASYYVDAKGNISYGGTTLGSEAALHRTSPVGGGSGDSSSVSLGTAYTYPNSLTPIRVLGSSSSYTGVNGLGDIGAIAGIKNARFHFASTGVGNFYVAITYLNSFGNIQAFFGVLPVTPRRLARAGKDYPYCFAYVYNPTNNPGSRGLLGGQSGYAINGHVGSVAWQSVALQGPNGYDWVGVNLPGSGGVLDQEQEAAKISLYYTSNNLAALIGDLRDIYGTGQAVPSLTFDGTHSCIGNLWVPTAGVMESLSP